jgi:hypothetical protein
MSDPQTSQPPSPLPATSPSEAKAPMPPANVPPTAPSTSAATADKPAPAAPSRKPEVGGPTGPEPTRYGDWEKAGRCVDF